MLNKFFAIFLLIGLNLLAITQFGSAFGDNKDNFFNPTITKKYNNEYYLADYLSGDLMVYDKDYKLKRVYSTNQKLNDLNRVGDELWISIGSSGYIKIINLLNNEITKLGREGVRQGEFSNPGEIEKDDKYIYIVDEYNTRVEIFDTNKNFVKEISLPKSRVDKESFKLNYSIKLLNNELYVLDKSNRKLYKYENFQLKETVDLKNFNDPYKLYMVNKTIYVYEKSKNEFVDIVKNRKVKLDLNKEVSLVDIKSFGEGPLGVYITKNSQLYYFSLIAETSRPLKVMIPVSQGQYIKPIEIKRDENKNVYILDEVLNEILVYSGMGKFIKKITDLPHNSSSFDIDLNGDIIILSNKTNSIFRLNSSGRLINSVENSENFMAYEPFYYVKKDKKIFIDNTLYKNKIIIDKNKSLIYVTDNKNKRVNIFNAKFKKVGELGKKESVINTISKKVSPDTFSYNDFDRNSLNDIQISDNLYVVDSPYKRIMIFSNDKFIKTIEHEKFSKGIYGINEFNDKFYIIDKDFYKIYVFSKELKFEKEINMAQKGYKPIKMIGNLLIATSYVKEFNEKYVILDLTTLF